MTAVTDPALGFWLRQVAAAGGIWEPDGDAAYVVLPPPLRDAYRLPEELRVTADPDVAREDGATLLAAGHPVLAEAAERVLASGDAGHLVLARPASAPPGRDVLLAGVRDAFPIDHGRIDLSGEPAVVLHAVIRVGALVTYELSAEDRFQEEAQHWVDVPSRRELPADLAWLGRAEVDEHARSGRPEGLLPAIDAAHRSWTPSSHPPPPLPSKSATAAVPTGPAVPAAARPTVAAKPASAADKPVPQAKRRRVVPPKVRREQQKATATLAERLWCAVAADDRRAIRRILHPGSPAAAIDRALGPAGLCRVLGMPAGEEPTRFLAEANGDVVTGALLSTAGTECPYHIYCRDGQAAEVLPFPTCDDGAFWGFYWWGQRSGGRWAVGRIVPAEGLDPVEGQLAVTGSAWNGLPVAARALAAWARIAGHHERLLSAHTARPLAAAVNRLVACRAGGQATFAEAAGQFRVPEQDLRRADRAVRTPLALGPGQPW